MGGDVVRLFKLSNGDLTENYCVNEGATGTEQLSVCLSLNNARISIKYESYGTIRKH